MEPDRSQFDRTVACVIAQQFFFSPQSRHWSSIPKGKNSARVSKTVISFLLFFLIAQVTNCVT
jgi:hypothetical protein